MNAYYSQFEEDQGVENPEQNLPEATPQSADLSASEEELAERRERTPGRSNRAGPADAGRTDRDELSAGNAV